MSDTTHLPRPPFAAQKPGDLATLMALRRNPLELWGPPAYREGVLEGSFLGRPHFLVNDPEAIHRVMVANVGNYVRDNATRRIMHPVFGEGLFLAEGESWRSQRRMIAPSMAPRDLLDMLACARDAGTGAALDPATLRDDVATMILAGHETTAVTLFWACFLFGHFPAWQEELATEAATVDLSPEGAAAAIPSLTRLRRHVDETLRLDPPAFVITREALDADELGGQTVAAGALITISPFVVHRHEAHWHDPDRFDPARFAAGPPARYTYLPFGAGPRVCIGATFALTEVVVVLGRLLQRFHIELAPGHHDVRPRGSVTTHPDRRSISSCADAESVEPRACERPGSLASA